MAVTIKLCKKIRFNKRRQEQYSLYLLLEGVLNGINDIAKI